VSGRPPKQALQTDTAARIKKGFYKAFPAATVPALQKPFNFILWQQDFTQTFYPFDSDLA